MCTHAPAQGRGDAHAQHREIAGVHHGLYVQVRAHVCVLTGCSWWIGRGRGPGPKAGDGPSQLSLSFLDHPRPSTRMDERRRNTRTWGGAVDAELVQAGRDAAGDAPHQRRPEAGRVGRLLVEPLPGACWWAAALLGGHRGGKGDAAMRDGFKMAPACLSACLWLWAVG